MPKVKLLAHVRPEGKLKYKRRCLASGCGHLNPDTRSTCGLCDASLEIAGWGPGHWSVQTRCETCGEKAAVVFEVRSSADEYVTRWHEHHDVPGHKRLIPAPFKKPKNYVPPEQMALTETEER